MCYDFDCQVTYTGKMTVTHDDDYIAHNPMSDKPKKAASRDVSRQALSIARALDRMILLPGRYTIIIDVPAHRRMPWEFELSRLDTLRRSRTRGKNESE